MQFLAITVSVLVSCALAVPTTLTGRHGGGGGGGDGGSGDGGSGDGGSTAFNACAGTLYDIAQCCATDVLGVADLNCAAPSTAPKSSADFQEICAAIGQQDRCCVLPALGQGILCTDPVAV